MPVLLGTRRALLGGGQITSPAQVSGLALWLDASYGVTTDGGAQFTAANSESLSVADNAALSAGDVALELGVWVRFDTLPGVAATMTLAGKSSALSNEYLLFCDNTAGTIRFMFRVRNTNDLGATTVTASTFGTPSTATWYFVSAYHDPTADTIGIAVNGGAFNTAAHTAGVRDAANGFRLGATDDSLSFLDGRMDSVGVWKVVLSSAIRSTLYNAGAGRTYADLTATEKASLQAWWDLDELSGTRNDSHGTNHLTDNNTVTANPGIAAGAAGDADPVSLWTDRSGNAAHATQATHAKKPTLRTNVINGRPVLRFDGTDDFMAFTLAAVPNAHTVFVVFNTAVVGSDSGLFRMATGATTQGITHHSTGPKVYSYFGSGINVNVARAAATWSIATRLWDGGATAANMDLWLNGTVATTKAGTPVGTGLAAAGAIGERSAGLGYYNGDVAAVLVYRRDLNTRERRGIEKLLGREYALAV